MENQIISVNLNANHVQFYMTARQLENEPLLTANRHLYEALKEKRISNHLRRASRRAWWHLVA